MSKIIVPLHVTNFTGSVGSVDPGFKKFYLKNGYFKLYDGSLVSDLVLDRPLDGFTPITGIISSSDTVLIALEKLQYAISNTVYSGGSLQSVTDNGAVTNNTITITNIANTKSVSLNSEGYLSLSKDNTFYGKLKTNNILHDITLEYPNKPQGTYTIATTSDVTVSETTAPITADLEVGGIAAQQVIPSGTDIQEFVTLLLNKTYYPVLTAPTFSLTNNAGVREIGSNALLTLTFNFYRGDILGNIVSSIWQPNATQGYRAGTSTSYTINGNSQGSNILSISPTLLAGGNTFNATVTYGTGIQPIDSKGNPYDTPLPSATSSTQSTTVQGIYPYFWYKSSSPITAVSMQTAIANGSATKVVGVSTGTITITFAAVGEYLAFAYPETSTTKTVWYVTALSTGSIPGGVFGSATVLSCNSPTSLWSGINYNIHVTAGLITESAQMQLRNS